MTEREQGECDFRAASLRRESERPDYDRGGRMKKATMTDAEYAAAKSHHDALWDELESLRAVHEAAQREWYAAISELKLEMQAREIDRRVDEALSEQQPPNDGHADERVRAMRLDSLSEVAP